MVLTVHHLHVSQSERVVWLCSELDIPHELKTYRRAPLLAPPEYKALHPAGAAPIIQDGDLTLAESGAVVEYICQRHGGGRLILPPSHPDYPHFLFWFHWANGSLMPSVGRLMGGAAPAPSAPSGSEGGGKGAGQIANVAQERVRRALNMMDERLRENEWLAGKEFTAADIMVVFPLTTMRYFAGFSLAAYPNLLRYLERIGEREAYRRAMEKGDPGMELLLGAEPAGPGTKSPV